MENEVMEIRISCRRKSIPVVLETEEGGEKNFTLQEMTGKMRDDYLTGVAGKMRYNTEGKPCGLKSYQDLQSGLLSFCLYENGSLVPIKEIRELPATAQKALFLQAQELNSLQEDIEEVVKND